MHVQNIKVSRAATASCRSAKVQRRQSNCRKQSTTMLLTSPLHGLSPLRPAKKDREMSASATNETKKYSVIAEPFEEERLDDGGGDGGKGGAKKGYGGSGDSEGDSGQGPYWNEVSGFLAGLTRSLDSFPADFRAYLIAGVVPVEVLKRYIALEQNFIMRLLMTLPGFRNKLLADPGFAFKVGVEVGIGIITKCSAEYQKRKGNFKKELDFVCANVIMALIADFMLVWLPAPAIAYNIGKKAKKGISMSKMLPFLGQLPKNAFQKVPLGMQPFSFPQRVGAIAVNGSKLFSIGTFASFVGVAVTNSLLYVREKLSPEATQLNKPQGVLSTSMLYGGYMGINSNLRYQMVAGIEERVLSPMIKNSAGLATASTILRVGNTYLGSLMWVDTLRLFGMQPKSKEE